MRVLATLLLGTLLLPSAAQQDAKPSAAIHSCREFGFDGRVKGGEEYSHVLGGRLWLRLLPLNDGWGWIIQVQPEGSNDDYGFPLNPPYHGDNVQWLGTGYGETVEPRLKFEHRVFFASSRQEHELDVSLYEEYVDSPGNKDPSAAGKFLPMLPSLHSAVLKLKPGNYQITNEGKSVSWLEFSVTAITPESFHPAAGMKLQNSDCPSGGF